ncbi:cysteate racemase [Actinotalea fermentans]|uniref:Aspartate racemase n=1 Tax=Actinotalea fermentans TaxID=43671 RepID=A0A511YU94_9CELL|nr:amino acid racemase [Actinotalea fermentans]KGM17154.1 aspartate racemase [Actinotalea fermentans ATCC 43279 = JCM 9966 = DSM 3133]GEN78761.1 aspartate racemase [Actinotalea fermentans]
MSARRLPVGVIGGVGPQATAYFLDMVVRLTQADRDQDHLDMVVLNHASIPDRTAFILGRSTEDPGPVMADDARRLAAFGVDFLVLPCNTAHHFTQEIEAAVAVPLVNIVDETVAEVRRRVPGVGAVGLLATSGTVRAGVYQRAIEAAGARTVLPDDEGQASLMRIIYEQVKAGRPVDLEEFRTLVERVRAQGAEAVVLGCTELSVVAADFDLLAQDRSLVDSLDVLARRTIERAGGTVRA